MYSCCRIVSLDKVHLLLWLKSLYAYACSSICLLQVTGSSYGVIVVVFLNFLLHQLRYCIFHLSLFSFEEMLTLKTVKVELVLV